jgi:hypothetical protein
MGAWQWIKTGNEANRTQLALGPGSWSRNVGYKDIISLFFNFQDHEILRGTPFIPPPMEFRDVVPEAHEGYMADMDLGEPYSPTELPAGDATENYVSPFIDTATTFDWYDRLEGLGRGGAVSL